MHVQFGLRIFQTLTSRRILYEWAPQGWAHTALVCEATNNPLGGTLPWSERNFLFHRMPMGLRGVHKPLPSQSMCKDQRSRGVPRRLLLLHLSLQDACCPATGAKPQLGFVGTRAWWCSAEGRQCGLHGGEQLHISGYFSWANSVHQASWCPHHSVPTLTLSLFFLHLTG